MTQILLKLNTKIKFDAKLASKKYFCEFAIEIGSSLLKELTIYLIILKCSQQKTAALIYVIHLVKIGASLSGI